MRWQLSAARWELLTEMLFPGDFGLEVYPSPIEVRAQGRSDIDRSRIRAEAGAELRRLGLLRADRVEPDLAGAIRLLHRPAVWVHSVWCPHSSADQLVRVVAGCAGQLGVCAAQYPEQPGATLLEVIPATGLAAAVVGKLPAHPPGRSPALTVPLESLTVPLESNGNPPDRNGVLVSASTAMTSTERDAAAAAAILGQPPSRAGQIAANGRDPAGRPCRSNILCWRDNPDGRYQITVNPADRLTVGPADPQRLGEGVQRLLASVQAR